MGFYKAVFVAGYINVLGLLAHLIWFSYVIRLPNQEASIIIRFDSGLIYVLVIIRKQSQARKPHTPARHSNATTQWGISNCRNYTTRLLKIELMNSVYGNKFTEIFVGVKNLTHLKFCLYWRNKKGVYDNRKKMFKPSIPSGRKHVFWNLETILQVLRLFLHSKKILSVSP